MKIREGFVSNSSSSSFLIASKVPLTKFKLKQVLLNDHQVLAQLVDEMADRIATELTKRPAKTIEEYVEDCFGEDTKQTNRWREKGLTHIYRSFFSDEDTDIDSAICRCVEINVETDDIAIEKEAGY